MVSALGDPVHPFLDLSHLLPVIESLPSELTDEEQDDATRLVHAFPDVSSCSEFDLGRTSLITHHIDMSNAKSFHQGLWRHPQIYMDVIDAEITKMEAAGVIEAACSPWASCHGKTLQHPTYHPRLPSAQQHHV